MREGAWLNGKKLDKTMGNYRGWGWNYAGKVRVSSGPVMLELEDLTGFNGRCDAIYLCNRYRTPTNQSTYLPDFRNRLTAGTEFPEKSMEFDLVVVGGGIAGAMAALAAARRGAQVLLLERYGFLGGTPVANAGPHWCFCGDTAGQAGLPGNRWQRLSVISPAVQLAGRLSGGSSLGTSKRTPCGARMNRTGVAHSRVPGSAT